MPIRSLLVTIAAMAMLGAAYILTLCRHGHFMPKSLLFAMAISQLLLPFVVRSLSTIDVGLCLCWSLFVVLFLGPYGAVAVIDDEWLLCGFVLFCSLICIVAISVVLVRRWLWPPPSRRTGGDSAPLGIGRTSLWRYCLVAVSGAMLLASIAYPDRYTPELIAALERIRNGGLEAIETRENHWWVRRGAHPCSDQRLMASLDDLRLLPGEISIDARDSSVGDEGVAAVLTIPAVSSLHLDDTKVSERGLALLVGNDNIKELFITCGDYPPEVLLQIKELGCWLHGHGCDEDDLTMRANKLGM